METYSSGLKNSSLRIKTFTFLPFIPANKIAVVSLYGFWLGSTAIQIIESPYLRVVGSVKRSPGASSVSGGFGLRTAVSRTGASFTACGLTCGFA